MYDDLFYENHGNESYESALHYGEILSRYYQPSKIVDVGCGRGAWLKAFKQHGATTLVGIDGKWNNQSLMIDESISFQPYDLDQDIIVNDCYDLAICVEVAEHLEKSAGYNLIKLLTTVSPVIIFGAAFIRQGGQGHINEDEHSNWANLFDVFDFAVFDLFRQELWGKESVNWWYQQNTFLYVNRQHYLYTELKNNGIHPVSNTWFLNCIHPYLYAQKKDD